MADFWAIFFLKMAFGYGKRCRKLQFGLVKFQARPFALSVRLDTAKTVRPAVTKLLGIVETTIAQNFFFFVVEKIQNGRLVGKKLGKNLTWTQKNYLQHQHFWYGVSYGNCPDELKWPTFGPNFF